MEDWICFEEECCEECTKIFEEGEEFWRISISEEGEETGEFYSLCEDCYRDFIEESGEPYIKDPGDDGNN